ncbi:hypothetical protein AN948_27925 [Rhodococcus sp. ADH]|nr:hypothetical protein C1M55_01795 [Rhodococcus qingshengii]KPH16099.1 hypothetical protein AN948_27925 [Rhodococcus sp. ADH]OKA13549.1 hypothetical protein BS618_18215 [Rhodococcus erythropolis]OMQ31406.1 hypothetical protein BK799_20230 [Rhodococcus sp. D-1]
MRTVCPKHESHRSRELAMADLTLLTDDELRERRIALSRSLTTAADLIPTPPPSFFEKLKQDIDAAAAEWIARRY